MKQLIFTFGLVLFGIVCYAAEPIKLPRSAIENQTLQTEEVDAAGQKGYKILSDHYEIMAENSEYGIGVAKKLEHLHAAWQTFFDEIIPVKETKPNRYHVVIYRDKKEYVNALQKIDRAIVRTNGFYFAPNKTAYFFPSEDKVLFHEGTHQLFAETFFGERIPNFCNNFWLIEGIALFMETLKIEEKCYTVGDITDNRLYAAKVYQFERNYNLPIQKLAAMNAAEIQTSSEIIKIYDQSAALVHLLMFAGEGHHRKPLFELLRQVYCGEAKKESLSELTGFSFKELDEKYIEFLKTIP